MSDSLLPVVAITDLPSEYDRPVLAVGKIKDVIQSRSQSGEYIRLDIAIDIPEGPDKGTAHARFQVKPEWFDPEWLAEFKRGGHDAKERIQFSINVARHYRTLFQIANVKSSDTSLLKGTEIGVSIDYRYKAIKNEAGTITGYEVSERPELDRFFAPKDLQRQIEYRARAAQKRADTLAQSGAAQPTDQLEAVQVPF